MSKRGTNQIDIYDGDDFGDTFEVMYSCVTLKYCTKGVIVELPKFINCTPNKEPITINIRLPDCVSILKGHFAESDPINKLYIHADGLRCIDHLFEGIQYHLIPYIKCWRKIESAVRTFANAKIKQFDWTMDSLECCKGMFAGHDPKTFFVNIGKPIPEDVIEELFDQS